LHNTFLHQLNKKYHIDMYLLPTITPLTTHTALVAIFQVNVG